MSPKGPCAKGWAPGCGTTGTWCHHEEVGPVVKKLGHRDIALKGEDWDLGSSSGFASQAPWGEQRCLTTYSLPWSWCAALPQAQWQWDQPESNLSSFKVNYLRYFVTVTKNWLIQYILQNFQIFFNILAWWFFYSYLNFKSVHGIEVESLWKGFKVCRWFLCESKDFRFVVQNSILSKVL